MLLVECQKAISADKCYPANLRSMLENHEIKFNKQLIAEIDMICKKLLKTWNAEEYYSSFYANIVMYASTFLNLEMPMSTLMMKKLAEKLFYKYKCPKQTAMPQPEGITDREIGGLQYLCGYIVHKFIKKTKNSPQYQSDTNQTALKLLEHFVNEDTSNQKLIDTKSRGGLKATKEEIQNIFLGAEKLFRSETNSSTRVDQISTTYLVEKLLKDPDIISTYNSIVGSAGVLSEHESSLNLLENMLELFFRVRSFSFARDILNKHKNSTRKTKHKSLRKGIKKATKAI